MTPLLTLTRPQGNNRALIEGDVTPRGYALRFADVPVLVHGFRRMVRDLEFDVAEMALTTYLTAREHGVAFTALPIFLVRGFHHGAIVVKRDGAITEPRQLTGRRIGVNRGYTVTTGVWARGLLADEHGLDLDSVTWILSGDEHVASYRPPANVRSGPAGTDLRQLLLDGAIDAAIGVAPDGEHIVPLIPEPLEAGFAALHARGHYPINHLVVVRDDLLERNPDLAQSVFDAFGESKDRYVAALERGEIGDDTDRLYARIMSETGADPLPYGLEANRATLADLVTQARRQHILQRPVDLDEVFAPVSLER